MDNPLDAQLPSIQTLVRLCLVAAAGDGRPADRPRRLPRATATSFGRRARASATRRSTRSGSSAPSAPASRRGSTWAGSAEALGATLAGVDNSGDLGLVLWAAAATSRPSPSARSRRSLDFGPLARERGGGRGPHDRARVGRHRPRRGARRRRRRRARRARAASTGPSRTSSAQRGASGLFCFARPLAPAPPPGRRALLQVRARLLRRAGLRDRRLPRAGRGRGRSRGARGGARGRRAAPRAPAPARPVGVALQRAHRRRSSTSTRSTRCTRTGWRRWRSSRSSARSACPPRPRSRAGVAWLFGENELGERLVDEERGVVWRSIRRRAPLRAVVYPLKLASLAGVGRGLDLGARLAGPRTLEVDREMRPYHLGWCLYALAELAGEPRRAHWPSPTLKTGEPAPGPAPGIALGMRVLHVLDRSLPGRRRLHDAGGGDPRAPGGARDRPVALTGVAPGRRRHHRASSSAASPLPHHASRRRSPRLGARAARRARRSRWPRSAAASSTVAPRGARRPDPRALPRPLRAPGATPPRAASACPSVYEIRAFWEDAAAQQGRGRRGSARYGAIRAAETFVARSVDAVVAICDGIRRDLARPRRRRGPGLRGPERRRHRALRAPAPRRGARRALRLPRQARDRVPRHALPLRGRGAPPARRWRGSRRRATTCAASSSAPARPRPSSGSATPSSGSATG